MEARSTKDGSGKTIYLGCLVRVFAEPELGIYRVIDINTRGSKGTSVFMEKVDEPGNHLVYLRNHLEVI